MRVIKLGIISIIFLFLLVTGISLFFPSHVRISKAIDINSSRAIVMAQINNPDNWKNWFPGVDSIKNITIIEKNDSLVRAVSTGPGSRQIEMGWNIFSGTTVQPVTIQWYMDFHLKWYPWEKFSSLLLERSYGPRMEKGLSALKGIIEAADSPSHP